MSEENKTSWKDPESPEIDMMLPAIEMQLSLVGSRGWKARKKAMVASGDKFKESPKEYQEHCIQLEYSYRPQNYAELIKVHTLAELYWIRERLVRAVGYRTNRELKLGHNPDKAGKWKDQEIRMFNMLDKAIIRNEDTLMRLQGYRKQKKPSTDEVRNDLMK